MSRPWPLALGLALLGACEHLGQGHSEVPPAFAEKLAFCEKMDSEVEDWCVLSALQTSDYNLGGETILGLCRGMQDTDAHDACLEFLSRLDASQGMGDLCAQVMQVRLRESCYLSISERAMRAGPSIEDGIAACRKAGSLQSHCLSHLPAQRSVYWQQNGGFPLMGQELGRLVSTEPDALSLTGLGFGTGVAALALGGPQAIQACYYYGNSEAGRACQEAVLMSVQGPRGSIEAPLSAPQGAALP